MKIRKEDIKTLIVGLEKKFNKFPTIKQLAMILGLSPLQVMTILDQLVKENFLIKMGNNFSIYTPNSSNVEKLKKNDSVQIKNKPLPTITPIKKLVSNTKEKVALTIEDKTNFFAIPVIKYSMLIVGIGSIIISAYYNILLALDFLPLILAVIAGCIFVLFSVIDFEAMLLISTFTDINKWKRRLMILGLASLWIIAAIFSITSVVNGRYEKYMANQTNKSTTNININVGRLKWKSIQDRKENLLKRIEDKSKQVQQLQKISAGIQSIEDMESHGRTFENAQWKSSVAEKELEKYNKDLEKVRQEESDELKNNPESTEASSEAGKYTDFYMWLSTIFGITKEKIHFLISLAPAFFFDVISPVSLALFLFLRKNN